jgi:hypothetical protein
MNYSQEVEVRLSIVGGALVVTQLPVYEKHYRGRNWMAKVRPDANSPGGWARSFATQARGDDLAYLVKDVFPNDVLEFGADYVTSTGKKCPKRVYALVMAVDTELMTVSLFTKPMEAWQARVVLGASPSSTPLPTSQEEVNEAVLLLERLPTEARLSVLASFCRGCGRKEPEVGPFCQCMNDE